MKNYIIFPSSEILNSSGEMLWKRSRAGSFESPRASLHLSLGGSNRSTSVAVKETWLLKTPRLHQTNYSVSAKRLRFETTKVRALCYLLRLTRVTRFEIASATTHATET